jgi:prevent-host-death family protein
MEASMHEAKTGLSKLVERALAGEDVILTKGKGRIPIARIVPITSLDLKNGHANPPMTKRPIGLFAGEFEVGPEFFDPLPEEELALWEAPLVSTWPIDGSEPDDSK